MPDLVELIGWLGNTLLALCALPQAHKSWREGKTYGISDGLLWFWFLGEVFACIYAIPLAKAPLIMNYLVNILALCVIMRYRYWPRRSDL